MTRHLVLKHNGCMCKEEGELILAARTVNVDSTEFVWLKEEDSNILAHQTAFICLEDMLLGVSADLARHLNSRVPWHWDELRGDKNDTFLNL